MEAWPESVGEKMRRLYSWLSEKDRRRNAAIETEKLGHGGTDFIAKLFGCDPKTIPQGMKEFEEEQDGGEGCVRKKGVDVRS